jgi:CRISPR-associated endonuclease/helicase Cas3
MNAMYDRLQRIYPGRVGLLHGRSALSLYQRLMDQAYTPAEATRLAKGERNLAGLPYYPVRVFSPYQMLKAVFQLKGYEAMLTDFAGGAFVFDEIHAYEPARLAMILETVRLLADRFGATFLIMSATLPAPVRERLGEVLHPLARVRAEPGLYARFRRHRLRLADGDLLDPERLGSIIRRYEAGEQILVVCNTVARAQAAWSWFRERLPAGAALSLIHGRFNGRDRGRKEQQVLARTGVRQPGAGGEVRRAALVVATQVVEVSLNLDLDALYSDPAPLDALWQRFGRVNRLGRRALAPVTVFRQPSDGQHIYDPILVQNTLALLEDAARAGPRPVDEALAQDWLDLVYSGPALEAWEAKHHQAGEEFRAEFLSKLIPFQAQPGLADAFGKLFDGLEVLPEPLYDEYQALKSSDRALEASQLLVSLGWGHYQMLRGKGLVAAGEKGEPPVVQVGYDGEVGLRLEIED